ncbi:TIGR03759 family integrating conjugative element protein [Halomonas dongshanensis]|uniref:TIGR03759 family integrating conjugative element protein n=1 Tax=Halomonas dongshanensis TaxID=2890835 RepID=A0ABT2EHJ3_9GAMM|nr:TIGR03759 family integrating conjugative element protein [Halomonas dongshanensis]MCS2611051.1 TIGR03759 family integrating conjugative element protein [Halomonas dongshanensis]
MTLNRNQRLSTALLLFAALPVWAQQGQESEATRIEQTRLEQSSQRAAEAWGLNQQEYRRYESIMEGPRGIWSPGLDPLTALGLEARSQAERQRYAEKLVETERARVEAELAFQRAYDDAWQRLYPNDMPVNSFSTRGGEDATRSVFGSNPSAASQRLNVVVATEGCDQCEATVKRLLNNGVVMDIWVVDSNGDDDRIRRWAAQIGIPPAQVRAGTVTLNHGGSLNVDRAELPSVAPRG